MQWSEITQGVCALGEKHIWHNVCQDKQINYYYYYTVYHHIIKLFLILTFIAYFAIIEWVRVKTTLL